MPDVSMAPWTAKQVQSLNDYQASGVMHPFTCPRDHWCEHGVLVATEAGWICGGCDYRQNWAHPWMANWAWRTALETGIGAWLPGCVAYDPQAERLSRCAND